MNTDGYHPRNDFDFINEYNASIPLVDTHGSSGDRECQWTSVLPRLHPKTVSVPPHLDSTPRRVT